MKKVLGEIFTKSFIKHFVCSLLGIVLPCLACLVLNPIASVHEGMDLLHAQLSNESFCLAFGLVLFTYSCICHAVLDFFFGFLVLLRNAFKLTKANKAK